eukprot:403367677
MPQRCNKIVIFLQLQTQILLRVIDRREANLQIPRDLNQDVVSTENLRNYRMEKLLGRGTFGDVYKVGKLQKFAMKKLKDETLSQDDINEIKLMMHIKSEYLCELIDICYDEEQKLCLVSEFAQFGDLRKYSKTLLLENGNIAEDLVKEWFACSILGLRELHVRGIIHRDIKPDNLLVFNEKKVRIGDYGLAMIPLDQHAFGSDQHCGTRGYMSPEIFSRQKYTTLTDIYSLGITFIEILTSEIPNEEQIKDPNWLPEVKGYSEGFLKLLKQMVSYKADKRPKIVQMMFSPVLSKTQTMIDYKTRYGILALGFMNISQDLIEQLSQQDVGCPNCALVLCDECMKKKEESAFIAIQSLLKHSQNINKKIEEIYIEAQDEVKVMPIVKPEVNVEPYQIVLDQVQAIVESNLKKENIIQQTINQIDILEEELNTFDHQEIIQATANYSQDSKRNQQRRNHKYYIEKQVQTEDMLIEVECQSESEESNSHQNTNRNQVEQCVNPKPEQNTMHQQSHNQSYGQNQVAQNYERELDQPYNQQRQHMHQIQPKILSNYQPLRSRPSTPSGTRQTPTIFQLQPATPIQVERSSQMNFRSSQSQSNSRNMNNIGQVQNQSNYGRPFDNGNQGHQFMNRTFNHNRNRSDLSQINNNVRQNFTNTYNMGDSHNRKDQSIDIKNRDDLDSFNIKISLKHQGSEKKKVKYNGQLIGYFESRNQNVRDSYVDRGVYSTIQNQRSQVPSLIVSIENELEQDFNDLVGKEVDCHQNSLLKDYLPNGRNMQFELKYKASHDGFSQKALIQSMQSHTNGSTLVFIQSDQGQVFGGYLSRPWPKGIGKFKDEKAFIFNLTKKTIHRQLSQISRKNFQVNINYAFEHKPFQLFAFGDDIRIFENCDQELNSYCNLGHTYALPPRMNGTSKLRESYMAGEVNFKVQEIEIYALVDNAKPRKVMFSKIKALTKLQPQTPNYYE